MKALILIDIQNEFFPGGGAIVSTAEEAARNAQTVLEHF